MHLIDICTSIKKANPQQCKSHVDILPYLLHQTQTQHHMGDNVLVTYSKVRPSFKLKIFICQLDPALISQLVVYA